jgi:hypothetical protein
MPSFDEILTQTIELLQQQGRVSYGALKRRFELDEAYLQDLKDELIDAQRIATDENDRILVWCGAGASGDTKTHGTGESENQGIRRHLIDGRSKGGQNQRLLSTVLEKVTPRAVPRRHAPLVVLLSSVAKKNCGYCSNSGSK